jgi:methionyl-tRNA formyltransferase
MNFALFINGNLGLRVLEYLSGMENTKIKYIFVNSEIKRSSSYIEEVQRLVLKKELETKIILWDQAQTSLIVQPSESWDVDFAISALFGHIIPTEMITNVPGGILNLHPSLLPNGRGANPISWSIIEGKSQGVTLHLIDQNLDSGKIFYQEEIETSIEMSAGTIYEIAMQKLFYGLTVCFQPWISGTLNGREQGNKGTMQHQAREFDTLRVLEENHTATFGEFIRKLQATTFSDGRIPIFKDAEGNLWDITFKLSRNRGHRE